MPKGSQLSQLKAALSQAGISGNQNNGKKRKRSSFLAERDKAKKVTKLDEIHRKLNPFDVKVTKLKHDVGGRNVKGTVGKPARSRQAGIEQRKNTLLKEYEERNRAGGILDRRFGENDPTMSLEERMLERFTKERQRAAKRSAFNLDDEDDLTHYGQSLSNLDDFDDAGLRLDEEEEEEEGQIQHDIVRKTHFGGFGDDDDDDEDAESEEPARKKTKAEVMSEVIAKSKEHKLLRRVERGKGDTVRQELDDEFDSLRELLYATMPTFPTHADGESVEHIDVGSSTTAVQQMPEDLLVRITEDHNYNQHVRELAFDKRSKPTDRTKTEEELALEQKEVLENAELRRQRRMLGIDESDSEDEGRTRKKRRKGGDDLEDDFEVDGEEWGDLGVGLEQEASAAEESLEGIEDDESEGSRYDDEGEEDAGERHELVASSKNAKAKEKEKVEGSNPEQDLPYTFPCPATHEEFLKIIEDVEDKDIATVVQRIRALHHTSLAPENKQKLQALTTVLIDHILHATASPAPRFFVVSNLFPHLAALTKSYPTQSAEHFIKKLVLMQKNLKHGLSQGPLNLESKTWPGLSELSLLCIIGAVWPTSDLNHAVVSPARILVGTYLGLCRVRSIADLASGLFLCTLFLQYESLSKRFVPEAIVFLVNTLLHLTPHSYRVSSALPGSFPVPDFRSNLCRNLIMDTKSGKAAEPRKVDLPSLLGIREPNEQAKADLLALALDLLARFADMYKGLDGFIELYDPILEIVQNIHVQKLAQSLQTRIASLREMLGRLLKFARQSRQPLQLQTHKPIPIPTYIPKFEASSSLYMRRKDPDCERNEAAKLRHQYKQERKGAIRELRKDTRFLAGVALQNQMEKDRTYDERMKRVFGSIESERAEEKATAREKVKAKRRAGRK